VLHLVHAVFVDPATAVRHEQYRPECLERGMTTGHGVSDVRLGSEPYFPLVGELLVGDVARIPTSRGPPAVTCQSDARS